MVRQKVLIDTNIIIDHLRQIDTEQFESKLRIILKEEVIVPTMSSATIQELFAGQSSKKKDQEQDVKNILKFFKIVPVSSKIAEFAGKLMRDNQTIIKFADAQIAATAILEKAQLATLNKKDFASIKELSFYEKY